MHGNAVKILTRNVKIRSRYVNERAAGLQTALDDIGNERDCLLQCVEELEFETQEHKRNIWIT